MTIETFTQSQTLSNQWASIHNERVAKYFRSNNRDQSEEARKRQFLASLIRINPLEDSVIEQIRKVMMFNDVCGYAYNGLAPVYGVPMMQYQNEVEYQPQLMFRFRERLISTTDLPLRKYKLEKEISFRLFNEDIPKTDIQLKALATRIKAKFFAGGKAFSYTSGAATGTTVYRYKDEDKGYRLAIECSVKATVMSLIDKLLDVSGTKYDANKLSTTKFAKTVASEKITVLSKRVDKPRKGRFGKLHLYQVEYKQKGIRDKILIDSLGAIQV
jgi:hypothetical protein